MFTFMPFRVHTGNKVSLIGRGETPEGWLKTPRGGGYSFLPSIAELAHLFEGGNKI
jgi:hypothetical protein